MPPVVVGVAAGIAAAGVVSTAAAIAIGVAAAALTYAATPEFGAGSFSNEAYAQQQMLRSPAEPRRGIYGRSMVSGPLIFAEETGEDNEYLHLVVALAGHRCDAIETVYFGDEVAWTSNGGIQSKFASHARIKPHLGAQTAADSQLVSECRAWTNKHVGNGVTYLYVRLKYDVDVFPNGVPNIKALVKGKPVYDPRLDSTNGGAGSHRFDDPTSWQWSDNWALCVLDYTRFESGVGALMSEIDLPSYALAAQDSDEFVEYQTDDWEPRYTCNGTYTQDTSPASILEKMLTAGAGMQVYVGGKYHLYSGVYQGPEVLTLTEDDCAGDVDISPYTSRSELCNAVRGTFVDPESFYQPTDFTPYESAYYRDQDNGEYIDHDIDLPFTQSSWTAQRLAKLHLELNRAGMQITFPTKMIGLAVSVGKVVRLQLPSLGINQTFMVADWQFDFGRPVKLILRETNADIFEFDKGAYTQRDLAPNTTLPDPSKVPTVSGVVWVPSGDDANWQGELSWNAPGNNSAYRYRLEVVNQQQTVVYQASIEGTRHHVPKLDAGTYNLYLWAVNLFSNRSNLPASLTIGADAPPPVNGILADIGALSLTLRPQTAAAVAATTQFEVKGSLNTVLNSAEHLGQGKEVQWPNRHPNTLYYVWARSVNNYGVGAWFGPVGIQTSTDNSAVVQLIGEAFNQYTWFAWADDNAGTGFTTNETQGEGKNYLGVATEKKTSTPSGNWQDYTWTKIKTEIPPVFTPEEETQLDNLMAGKLPAGDKDMLAAQDALNNPALANNLLTSLALLNNGIDAASLNGETPAGAQSKASNAQGAAIAAAATDATTKANNAKAAAETYALAKANLAEVTAKAYADGKVTAEESRAIADAQAKADAAKTAAIAAAATDATTKANNAKAQAEANAALDALNKANAAKADAINVSLSSPLLKNESYYRTLPDPFFEKGLLAYSANYTGTSESLESLPIGTRFSVIKAGEHGGNVLRVQGDAWIYGIGLIPIDTSKRYKLKFKVKQHANGTGNRLVYAGVVTLDKDLNAISGGVGLHLYCAVSGASISEVDGWHTFEGYITGVGTTAHNQFRANTAYIRPVCIVNYSGGNGVADIDELSFYEVTEKGDLIEIGMETSTNAQAKADAAKNAAIAAAAADATTKANNAKAQAEANAALDALNKANTAKDDAISANDILGLTTNGSYSSVLGATCGHNSPSPSWDGSVYSKLSHNGGASITVTIESLSGSTRRAMVGLTTVPSAIIGYNDISFAIYADLSNYNIYESGSAKGIVLSRSPAVGDVLNVKYDGLKVYYSINGTVLKETVASRNLTLFFKAAFYGSGFYLNNITFTPLSNLVVASDDATNKANNAQSAAIAAAAADATTKANNAKAQAEANAALDALNKASSAKADAISTAATDAQAKANAAKDEAIAASAPAYRDQKTVEFGGFGDYQYIVIPICRVIQASDGNSNPHMYTTGKLVFKRTAGNGQLVEVFVNAQCGYISYWNMFDYEESSNVSGISPVTFFKNGVQYFGVAIKVTSQFQRNYFVGSHFDGFGDSIVFSAITYFTANNSAIIDSEIYNSITDYVSNRPTKSNSDYIVNGNKLETETGSQTRADSAKLQAIGDVAAGNFAAQTALITTLLANSGLFNQLKSRLGSFGGLTAETIAALAIATNHLQAGAVTVDKVSANAITAEKIAALAIATNHLQAGAVTVDKVGANAITAQKIAALAIATNHLQAGAVTVDKVGANAITADKIAALAIATNHLQAGVVTADKITADTALIQKLIANVGLFNQLQAQLGVFGGLAANSIAAGAIQTDKLAILAREYVNPVSTSGNLIGWGGVLEDGTGGNSAIISYDSTEKALVITSNAMHSVWCKSWKINHDKIYRISMKIKASSTDGSYYLGAQAWNLGNNGGSSSGGNAEGNMLLYPYSTGRVAQYGRGNAYFSYGSPTTEYIDHTVYLIGANRDVNDCPAHVGPSPTPFIKLDAAATDAGLRLLNWANTSTKKLFVKDISVTEVGAGQVVAQNIAANAVTADKIAANAVSAGKIAANAVTANEILADTALINKLVATSALFDTLQSRLAVFGGLNANSIAADAIDGNHIRAGSKIESPIIEGGEYRLIGANTMKIESETPFGPDNLIEWRGPKLLLNGQPNWPNIRKSNATRWTDANGDEYFGGSLSAGILKTGVTNPDKNAYAVNTYPVEIGPFSSGGKSKTVVVSFSYDSAWNATSQPSGSSVQLSWQLQRKIGSGSWATVSSGTFNGSIQSTWEAEIGRYIITEFCNGSSTFTDTTASTSDFSYRVKVISHTRYSTTSNVKNQNLTVISTEQ